MEVTVSVWDDLDISNKPVILEDKIYQESKIGERVLLTIQNTLKSLSDKRGKEFFSNYETRKYYGKYVSRSSYKYGKRKLKGAEDTLEKEGRFSTCVLKLRGFSYPCVVFSPFNDDDVMSNENTLIMVDGVYKYSFNEKAYERVKSVSLNKSMVGMLGDSDCLEELLWYVKEAFITIESMDETIYRKVQNCGGSLNKFLYSDVYVSEKTYEDFCQLDNKGMYEIPCYDSLSGRKTKLESGINGTGCIFKPGISFAYTTKEENRFSPNYIEKNVENLIKASDVVLSGLMKEVSLSSDKDYPYDYNKHFSLGSMNVHIVRKKGERPYLILGYYEVEGRASLGFYGAKIGLKVSENGVDFIVVQNAKDIVMDGHYGIVAIPIQFLVLLVTKRNTIRDGVRNLVNTYSSGVIDYNKRFEVAKSDLDDAYKELLGVETTDEEKLLSDKAVNEFITVFKDMKKTFGETVRYMKSKGYSMEVIVATVFTVLEDAKWEE